MGRNHTAQVARKVVSWHSLAGVIGIAHPILVHVECAPSPASYRSDVKTFSDLGLGDKGVVGSYACGSATRVETGPFAAWGLRRGSLRRLATCAG